MNIPYKKNYDKDGAITNPLERSYVSTHPNRKQRRSMKQKERFVGESKNYHLTVFNNKKYRRYKQFVMSLDGLRVLKTINHHN